VDLANFKFPLKTLLLHLVQEEVLVVGLSDNGIVLFYLQLLSWKFVFLICDVELLRSRLVFVLCAVLNDYALLLLRVVLRHIVEAH